jgi:hypothetical protein
VSRHKATRVMRGINRVIEKELFCCCSVGSETIEEAILCQADVIDVLIFVVGRCVVKSENTDVMSVE